MDDLELARRTDALKALARGLLADPHDAEDVVQEAWAASLEARPRDLLSWLRGTTRRLAARTLRGRVRRRRREGAAARPEAIPADAAAEADVLQALAAELAKLEEPYRTALVLRYYRDRTPLEIAADLSVPVATVKTRLRRGLAILRARLSRERRSWALVLAPLAARPVPLGLVLGVAGTVCVAALLFVGWRDRSTPEIRRATEAAAPARADTPSATADIVEEPPRPRAEVLVEGPDGPLADAEVKIAPLDRWSETTSARTDARGAAVFDLPEGEYEVNAEARGLVRGGAFVRAPGTTTIRLRAGCRLKLRLNPWPDPAWKQFRWSAQGEIHVERKLAFDAAEIDTGTWPAGAVSIHCAPTGGGTMRSVRIALPPSGEVTHEIVPPAVGTAEIEITDAETGAVVHEWTASLADVVLPRAPGTRFGTYRLPTGDGVVRIDAPGYARAFVGFAREGETRVALRRGVTLRLSFAPGARPKEVRIFYNSPAGGISSRGISISPGTLPPPGEELNLTDFAWETAYLARTITEADAWTGGGLPPEARLDFVGLDDQGLFAFRQVETGPPGSEATVDLEWTPTVRHRFVVKDKEGRPVPGAEIRIMMALGRRDTYLGSIRTDADGRGSARGFRTDRAYSVQIVHGGGAERRSLSLPGPDGETALVAEEQQRVRRRVLVLDDLGQPIPGARVQLGARGGFGSFAITGEDGIAAGQLRHGDELYVVSVSLEPGGGGALEPMMKPPADDPVVYRGDLGKPRVTMEIEGEGLVHARLKGGREQDLKVHVHGRGTASFQLRVQPGEYRVEATLDGLTVERALVVRAGEPAVVPLRFDR